MLTHNQEKFLQSLYSRRLDVINNILHIEARLQDEKDEFKIVEIAISNLEAEIEIMVNT